MDPTVVDAVVNASRTFASAYAYLYEQYQQLDLSAMPPADQVMATGSAAIQTVFGQTQQFVRTLPLQQANLLSIFLMLIILYIVYSLCVATVRWLFRLVYGFVRFSLLVAVLASLIYVIQIKMYGNSE
ncbi:hypothetical protein EC973_001785 [Apophysomyces ossiformis]|uniref:Uncharacterized protein n=1 Tax=Apophysomyces ossiformis TaxID=679940 RepID=A0A8H7BJ44_9FUNG|nr:hypothetical protein EC973_001785 [Apophysomyces ossiformis]